MVWDGVGWCGQVVYSYGLRVSPHLVELICNAQPGTEAGCNVDLPNGTRSPQHRGVLQNPILVHQL